MNIRDSMLRVTDQRYLKSQQYKTSSNLNARIQLHERFSTNKYDWPKWVFDHLELPLDSCIFELGCGTGYLWQENIDRIPDSWTITLSDFSPGMLQKAQTNLEVTDGIFRFEVVDAQHLPWTSESCEAVIANHMLYHVPDKTKALSEINRILKPGGKLYAATNGINHLTELYELIQVIDPNADQGRYAAEFGLENGREQLARYFSEVSLYVYKDALMVTEIEPLVAYVLSTQPSNIIEDTTNLAELIEQKMKARGYIYITKSAGLFEAQK
jgi:ubiquinone/menaquinone biosynthesis C-methylase UbiE